jgi:hypothetical protein
MRVMLENRERFANAQRPVVRGGLDLVPTRPDPDAVTPRRLASIRRPFVLLAKRNSDGMRVMLENRERFANAQRPVVRGGEAWILSLSLPVLPGKTRVQLLDLGLDLVPTRPDPDAVTPRRLASIRRWDPVAKKRLRQLPKYPAPISALSFNADGTLLAVEQEYSYLTLGLTSSPHVRIQTPLPPVVLPPFAAPSFATGGGDATVSLWDPVAKKRLRQLPKYPAPISALASWRPGPTARRSRRLRPLRTFRTCRAGTLVI